MKLPEIKLSYINPVKKSDRIKIMKAEEAVRVLRTVFSPDEIDLREQMIVLYLNNAGEVIGYTKHSVGGITGTLVDIRLILSGALKSASTGIILSHNHPSGNLNPSESDISITKKLREAAKFMELELIDHIIITKEAFFSFAEEGMNGIDGFYKSESPTGIIINESKSAKKEIILLDLFSGTGGFAKGFEEAGFKIKQHYFSEIDKYAVANYQYNFKNAINLGDVTKINTKKIQHPNIICFGSPCQDISIAGKRKGLKGKRSNLFFEAVRIINECRPDVFIFENVKGLFSSNQGKDFEVILQTFANLGIYDIQWQLLNTSWFLPQNRERVYFVGCLRGKTQQQIFPIGESTQGSDAFYQKESQRKTISPTIDTKFGESTHRSPYVLHWKGSSTKWNLSKYDHKEGGLSRDNTAKYVDVALATSAAPTYLPLAEIDYYDYKQFIDGGVWANNPSLIALIEALTYFVGEKKEYDGIQILSISSLNNTAGKPTGLKRNRAFVEWRNDLFETSMIGQSSFTHYFLSKLHELTDIPIDYTRIPSESISAEQQHLVQLDVATTDAIRLIKGKGNDRGTLASKDPEIAKFFTSPKTYKIN